ncbi:DUF3293 domain-containing protein [Membranihabitans marinus]|uniref:DUF3293 domain-containing protein n=1 Tax=Membranihabitans marinus TaxID=1227546 RepID=UPI001F1D9B59|nr:DUF3293 domain-containing protein [Membranihabitans marinus]
MNHPLHQAYLNTTYAVYHLKDSFNLRIDTSNLNFNQWCRMKNITCWAIITAFNPYSQALTKQENQDLNIRLKNLLMESGYSYNHASGIPNQGDWEAEPSFFIHNIPLEKAQEMGRLFKQNAIVYGQLEDSIKLIWLR